MVLLLTKLYLYFNTESRGGQLFSGGEGCPTLSRGVQILISIETHIRTCYFPGGVSGPPIPPGSAHGQCHHNGTIFITVRPLTITVRH